MAELARIAGIDRAVADQWVHRQLIKPILVKRAGSLKRPFFSVRAIFKARLAVVLNQQLLFGPGQSAPVSNKSDSEEVATELGYLLAKCELAETVAGSDWMYAAARGIDSGKLMQFWMAVTRYRKGWRWKLVSHVDSDKFDDVFGPDIPMLMLPLPAIFEPVYRACRKVYAAQTSSATTND